MAKTRTAPIIIMVVLFKLEPADFMAEKNPCSPIGELDPRPELKLRYLDIYIYSRRN